MRDEGERGEHSNSRGCSIRGSIQCRTPTGIAFAKVGPLTWLSEGTGGEEHPLESIRGRQGTRRLTLLRVSPPPAAPFFSLLEPTIYLLRAFSYTDTEVRK